MKNGLWSTWARVSQTIIQPPLDLQSPKEDIREELLVLIFEVLIYKSFGGIYSIRDGPFHRSLPRSRKIRLQSSRALSLWMHT